MSNSNYTMSRIQDALEQCDGNQTKAQKTILSWLEKDQTLLAGLVAPHLKAIIAHAVAHVAKQGAPARKAGETARSVPPVEPSDSDLGDFARELLEGLAGAADAPKFGESGSTGKPKQASQKHVDAIHAMASRSKGDKK